MGFMYIFLLNKIISLSNKSIFGSFAILAQQNNIRSEVMIFVPAFAAILLVDLMKIPRLSFWLRLLMECSVYLKRNQMIH